MADNDASNTSQTKAKAKQTTAVSGTVVLETKTFEPTQPILLDKAAEAFKAQVAETNEGKTVTNIQVAVAKHHVGKSVSYNVTGEIAG